MKNPAPNLTSPTARARYCENAAILVRREIRRIGEGGIAKVAKDLDLGAQTVRQYSQGTHFPNRNTAKRIHDIYGGGAK